VKSQDDFFFLAFLVIKKFGLRSFAREREREIDTRTKRSIFISQGVHMVHT
jgi:hypothetical protein